MKNKFALGALSGASALALSIPLLAEVSNAQTADTSSSGTSVTATNTTKAAARPPLSQADVQKLIDRDTAFLANIDAFVAIEKSATQAHKDALTAAASVTDDTQRQSDVQAADKAYRDAINAAVTANPDLKSAMMKGGGFGFDMRGPRGGMMNPDSLAKQLGMTAAELKTELNSGKTIEQIAQEKGVTLPAPPAGFGRGGKGPGMDMLAQKLGMTAAELKTELNSGKTIEQIAQEKGVTLPARPAFGRGQGPDESGSTQNSSAQ